jgi:hypothetical protein
MIFHRMLQQPDLAMIHDSPVLRCDSAQRHGVHCNPLFMCLFLVQSMRRRVLFNACGRRLERMG